MAEKAADDTKLFESYLELLEARGANSREAANFRERYKHVGNMSALFAEVDGLERAGRTSRTSQGIAIPIAGTVVAALIAIVSWLGVHRDMDLRAQVTKLHNDLVLAQKDAGTSTHESPIVQVAKDAPKTNPLDNDSAVKLRDAQVAVANAQTALANEEKLRKKAEDDQKAAIDQLARAEQELKAMKVSVVRPGPALPEGLPVHTPGITGIGFRSDGRYMAVVDGHNAVALVDVPAGKVIDRQHNTRIIGAGFTTNAVMVPTVLSKGVNHDINSWLMKQQEPQLVLIPGNWPSIDLAVFSADGKILAMGGRDSTITLVDTETLKPLKTINVSQGAVGMNR
jgi:hypothetical protein